MKVYCAGPIRGDTTYAARYRDIIRLVRQLGHDPLSELSLSPEQVAGLDDESIYRRDLDWLGRAGAMIAEVSAPSLGVGYEIAFALHNLTIPVLCLQERSSNALSAMISGNRSERLAVKMYGSGEELERIVKEFLERVTSA
jgi:hypothetical protein